MIELRDYQKEAAKKLFNILTDKKFAVLNAEMRTGKTFTAFYLVFMLEVESVLFITKKGAIKDIETQLEQFKVLNDINITIINFESLHKVEDRYDMIIVDEYHTVGYIQKKKAIIKNLEKIRRKYFLGLTGTLFLETFSTAYSLFPVCFNCFKTFYQFAYEFIDIRDKRIGQLVIKDYTKVLEVERIMDIISPYIVTLTQDQAGFENKVIDVLHRVKSDNLNKLCKIFKDKKMYTFKDLTYVVLENMSKEFQVIKQLQSGCLKISDENFKYLDTFKMDYILNNFKDKKFAIYYEYKAEFFMITASLAKYGYTVTNDAVEFNSTDSNTVFVGQFVSKREGINLSSCDDVIFFSMPYSNLTYLQTRERAITKSKTSEVRCHFIMTAFEEKVYKIITQKKAKFSSETYRLFADEANLFE